MVGIVLIVLTDRMNSANSSSSNCKIRLRQCLRHAIDVSIQQIVYNEYIYLLLHGCSLALTLPFSTISSTFTTLVFVGMRVLLTMMRW